MITGDAVLTLNFNSLRDLLRFKQRVSGPPWISTWNWPTAKQSVAALARLDPQVLAPGHGTPMANATAAKLRALAESLNARPRGLWYLLLPRHLSHSWLEVDVS